MKPSPFSYHPVASVEEAVQLLSELEDAKVLAGGQSLIPLMNFRLATPTHLIDISGLAELGKIKANESEVEIGASVTHSQVLQSQQVGSELPLLAEAEKLVQERRAVHHRHQIGFVAVRMMVHHRPAVGRRITHRKQTARFGE